MPPAPPANPQAPDHGLLTLADWRRAYLAGATPRSLVGARLARLAPAAADPAWILRLDGAALAPQFDALDRLAAALPDRRALLARHPLYGVPFAVKDNIDVEGLPTSAACPAFAATARASATVVRRLLDAGAVLVGKTNLDQFATGLVGTRSPYGAPASVFAADRVSGGSSSGSAVLVGRGELPFTLGTDTAGSGRVPAGFNGIVGLKPTPGRVSTHGVLPACRSLDCVSVFAPDVDTAAAVLAVIEGDDPADDYAGFHPGPAAFGPRLRVGVPRSPVLDAALGYDTAWAHALGLLDGLGAEVVPLDFEPLHATARLLYEGPWVAERYAVVQPLLDERPDALDPAVARVIAPARELSAVDTFRAQYRLRHAQRKAAAMWRELDVLMVPTAPRHPRFDEVAADPLGVNAQLGTYTNFVNLLGCSALALPARTTTVGLPFGITLIGPGGSDAALARLGQSWQRAAAMPMGATGRLPASRDAADAIAPGAGDDAAPPALPWPQSAPALPLAVVGAHLSGLPLNGQLIERGAVLREATTTAPHYRLFALPGTTPPKPGMLRVAGGGAAIAVEVWDLPLAAVGSFIARVPAPLAIGSIELADGRFVHGFLCEPWALADATDISHHGGWRAYLGAR